MVVVLLRACIDSRYYSVKQRARDGVENAHSMVVELFRGVWLFFAGWEFGQELENE